MNRTLLESVGLRQKGDILTKKSNRNESFATQADTWLISLILSHAA